VTWDDWDPTFFNSKLNLKMSLSLFSKKVDENKTKNALSNSAQSRLENELWSLAVIRNYLSTTIVSFHMLMSWKISLLLFLQNFTANT
jgi:hypothetical protein